MPGTPTSCANVSTARWVSSPRPPLIIRSALIQPGPAQEHCLPCPVLIPNGPWLLPSRQVNRAVGKRVRPRYTTGVPEPVR